MATTAPTDIKTAPQAGIPAAAPTGYQAPPDDMTAWTNRIKSTLNDPSAITNPTGTAEWTHGFFDCFNPIDTCLITWCCPCVTFGKTHHILAGRDPNSWSPLNVSCVGWYVAAIFGCGCIPTMMQRAEIRERSNPKKKGELVTDFLKAWCCGCCDLIQQDKEAEALLAQGLVMQEPAKNQGMNYPA